jgi:hypothetical protein
MRVAFLIGLLMMDAVRGDPEDGTAFKRQCSAEGEEVLDPFRGLVAAMGQEPVISHAYAEHSAGVVQNQCGEHRTRVDVEESRHGADVEPGHGNCGYPVQAGLMFPAV